MSQSTRYGIKTLVANITSEVIQQALLKALELAEKKREDAGYAGAMDDGGASALEMQVTSYANGWLHEVPAWLQVYVDAIIHESDSEYDEYWRLKEKFEGMARPKKRLIESTLPHWSDNKDKKGNPINKDIMSDFR